MSRLLLVALLLACTAAQAQLLVKDDAGRNLVVRKHATRIVTLAPFLTEAAYAAGAGDLVVGVDALSDYPSAANRLPRVPTGAAFSLDAVAALKPDLVLAWKGGVRMEDVEAMASYGATVYLAEARHLDDVPRLLQSIGALTGRNTREAATTFEDRLKAIRRANVNKPKLAVFLEIWNRPLTTVGRASLISEAIEACRGENVFADLGGMAPRVEFDEVQAINPYVILGVNSASNAEEFQANWALHPNIPAVRAGRMMYIESDALQRPSVRSIEAIAHLCEGLDEVRLHDSLIAPSEAFRTRQGAPLAEAQSSAPVEMLRRPMTAIERDVAAVLSSSYAVGKPGQAPAAPAAPAADAAPAASAEAAPERAGEARETASTPPPSAADPAAGPSPSLKLAGAVATPGRAEAASGSPGSYTQVSRYGDLYFVSGQIALDPASGSFDAAADTKAQTLGALENVRRVLEGENLTLANVVSATVYVRKISDLDAMDHAYESAFRTRLPARTVVEATNLPRGALVEIAVVAGR